MAGFRTCRGCSGQAEASLVRASGCPGWREEVLGSAGRMHKGAVSGEAQAVEDSGGREWIRDPRDPLKPSGASRAGKNVLCENPPDEVAPTQTIRLGTGHLRTTRAGNSSGLLARDNDLGSEPRVGSVDPVEPQGVLSRARDQGGQLGQKVERFEGYRRSPVPPSALHVDDNFIMQPP